MDYRQQYARLPDAKLMQILREKGLNYDAAEALELELIDRGLLTTEQMEQRLAARHRLASTNGEEQRDAEGSDRPVEPLRIGGRVYFAMFWYAIAFLYALCLTIMDIIPTDGQWGTDLVFFLADSFGTMAAGLLIAAIWCEVAALVLLGYGFRLIASQSRKVPTIMTVATALLIGRALAAYLLDDITLGPTLTYAIRGAQGGGLYFAFVWSCFYLLMSKRAKQTFVR